MSSLRAHFTSLRRHKRGLEFDLAASLTMSAHLDEIEAACDAAGVLDREPGEPTTGAAIAHEWGSEKLDRAPCPACACEERSGAGYPAVRMPGPGPRLSQQTRAESVSECRPNFSAKTSGERDRLLDALTAMKRAFGDPMTRRALGGHNEVQQAAILEASAAIAKATGEAGTWQVKDFADGWIDVPNRAAAERLSAAQSDSAIRPKPAGGEAGQ